VTVPGLARHAPDAPLRSDGKHPPSGPFAAKATRRVPGACAGTPARDAVEAVVRRRNCRPDRRVRAGPSSAPIISPAGCGPTAQHSPFDCAHHAVMCRRSLRIRLAPDRRVGGSAGGGVPHPPRTSVRPGYLLADCFLLVSAVLTGTHSCLAASGAGGQCATCPHVTGRSGWPRARRWRTPWRWCCRNDRRHDRAVGDPEPADAMHPQLGIHHRRVVGPIRQVPTGWK
jgi:hypothetical protein